MAVDTEPRPTVDARELAKAIIEELKVEFATKEDLARFATKEDLKQFLTTSDLHPFVTTDEFTKALNRMNRRMGRIEDTLAKVAKAVGVADLSCSLRQTTDPATAAATIDEVFAACTLGLDLTPRQRVMVRHMCDTAMANR